MVKSRSQELEDEINSPQNNAKVEDESPIADQGSLDAKTEDTYDDDDDEDDIECEFCSEPATKSYNGNDVCIKCYRKEKDDEGDYGDITHSSGIGLDILPSLVLGIVIVSIMVIVGVTIFSELSSLELPTPADSTVVVEETIINDSTIQVTQKSTGNVTTSLGEFLPMFGSLMPIFFLVAMGLVFIPIISRIMRPSRFGGL